MYTCMHTRARAHTHTHTHTQTHTQSSCDYYLECPARFRRWRLHIALTHMTGRHPPPHIPQESHSHRNPPLHSYICYRHRHTHTQADMQTYTHNTDANMHAKMTEKQWGRRSKCCFHSDSFWSTTEKNEQGETPADPEVLNEDRLHLFKLVRTWAWVCLCVCRPTWSTSMLFRLKTLSLPPLSCGMLQWLLGNYPNALFLCSQHH